MKLQAISEEIKTWSEGVGLSPVNQHQVPNVDFSVSFGLDGLSDISFEELDSAINRLSSYVIYLSSQKGSLIAYLGLLEAKFNQQLHTITEQNYDSRSFKKFEERKALALRTHSDLRKLEAKIIKTRAKLEKIKEMPHAIELKINMLKNMYQRRVYEEKQQG